VGAQGLHSHPAAAARHAQAALRPRQAQVSAGGRSVGFRVTCGARGAQTANGSLSGCPFSSPETLRRGQHDARAQQQQPFPGVFQFRTSNLTFLCVSMCVYALRLRWPENADPFVRRRVKVRGDEAPVLHVPVG
jgi:hypothetical protein